MTMIRNKKIYHTFSSLLFVVAIASATTTAEAQTKVFDLTRQQPEYNDSTGHGYEEPSAWRRFLLLCESARWQLPSDCQLRLKEAQGCHLCQS